MKYCQTPNPTPTVVGLTQKSLCKSAPPHPPTKPEGWPQMNIYCPQLNIIGSGTSSAKTKTLPTRATNRSTSWG